jgi:hypothetical protein
MAGRWKSQAISCSIIIDNNNNQSNNSDDNNNIPTIFRANFFFFVKWNKMKTATFKAGPGDSIVCYTKINTFWYDSVYYTCMYTYYMYETSTATFNISILHHSFVRYFFCARLNNSFACRMIAGGRACAKNHKRPNKCVQCTQKKSIDKGQTRRRHRKKEEDKTVTLINIWSRRFCNFPYFIFNEWIQRTSNLNNI